MDGTNIFFNEMKICQSTWLRMVRTLWHISDDFFELFTNSVISNFSSYYCPHKNIAIDETVRRFKGWFGSKVYAPDKPAKWGIKYYCLVDKRGYAVWFRLYRRGENQRKSEESLTLSLCKGCHQSHYFL